jgi:transcriptional regulator GlxA family with amidase domain
MSLRTFGRRFRDETGPTPRQWLIHRRLDRARHLLESSNMTVDQIASEIGFATAASLRQHMSAELGVSPRAHRRTYKAVVTPTAHGEITALTRHARQLASR